MNQLQVLLQESHKQYGKIIHMMESMLNTEVDNNLHILSTIGNRLLKVQQAATKTDKKIIQFLKNNPDLIEKKDLVQRNALLQEVIKLNTRITPRLTSIKSLMFSELQQLKNGRSAMKGYMLPERSNGRNINSTS